MHHIRDTHVEEMNVYAGGPRLRIDGNSCPVDRVQADLLRLENVGGAWVSAIKTACTAVAEQRGGERSGRRKWRCVWKGVADRQKRFAVRVLKQLAGDWGV